MQTESQRATMGGKPVFTVPVKGIINFKSGFAEKLLCDGPTFSTGTSCQYSCAFCYVPAIMQKSPLPEGASSHEDVVIRRADPVVTMRRQLTDSKGRPKFNDPNDRRVIYASPLVDVASNMELVRETVECCKVILELTNWNIRLLSKSNLLPKVAQSLEAVEYSNPHIRRYARSRVIYGVSTGTLSNSVAATFEQGTPLVSKRIESLHWLQDNGFRTFGMVCPSLPQKDYTKFAMEMRDSVRYDRCEHVWAEVINLRGESFTRTMKALREACLNEEADALTVVSTDKDAWEEYARATFLGHATSCPPEKLRFLQYVNPRNIDWWKPMQKCGAVLLGKLAHAA